MRYEDLEALRVVMLRNPWLTPASVIGPSAEGQEIELVSEVWRTMIVPLGEGQWNLDEPAPGHHRGHQVALVCNTFLCSRDPALWLRNIAQVADYLLVQDLSWAPRGQGRITMPSDGDRQRYSVSSHGVIGRTDEGAQPVFDLSTSGVIVLDCEQYFDGGKFVALLDLRPLREAPVDTRPWIAGFLAWFGAHAAELEPLLYLA